MRISRFRRRFWRSTSPSPQGLHTLVWVLALRRELFLVRPSAREVHEALVIGLSPAAIVLASVPVAYLASPVIAQLCWLSIIPIRVITRRWAAESMRS